LSCETLPYNTAPTGPSAMRPNPRALRSCAPSSSVQFSPEKRDLREPLSIISLRQNPMHSLKAMSTPGHRVASRHIALGCRNRLSSIGTRKAGDDWIYVFSYPFDSNHRSRKGLVTDVSGPQRNACPGTLTLRKRVKKKQSKKLNPKSD
jgi:hypothetical protein